MITFKISSQIFFRNIRKVYDDEVFHIDKSGSMTILTLNLAQLAGLLDDNAICDKLRKIVIDKYVYYFHKNFHFLTYYKTISSLGHQQLSTLICQIK